MAGLKDAYKNKSSEGYKDVFKEQSRKSGDYTSTPIEALRKPSAPAEKLGNIMGLRYLLPTICSPMHLN